VEVPPCPNLAHKGSRVVRDGWYGREPHRRQRWRCTPANGDAPHRFTPTLTRQAHTHAAPNGFCLECSTAVEPWEGQSGARTYLFAAREVGDALARVAQGSSYRAAAEAARVQAARVKSANPRPRPPTPPPPPGALVVRRPRRTQRVSQLDGQLVANWVDIFTPVVCDGLLPTRWPEVIVVDSRAFVHGSGASARRFNVIAAVGVDPTPGGVRRAVPKVVRIEPFPRKDHESWTGFLSSLEGTPRVIVSDADATIAGAIRTVFPRAGDAAPEHRLSEHHIKRALEDKLPPGLLGTADPIGQTYDLALVSPQRWAAFVAACEHEIALARYPMTLVANWLRDFGDQVAAQTATRDPHLPNSTGSVEAVLREVGVRIGERVGSFTNRARMANLLTLIAADIHTKSNGRLWADRIRERIYLAGGHARHQRPHDDRKGDYSLLG